MIRATSAIVLLALLMPSHEQSAPPSPCPDVFEYEKPGSEQGRWDGIMRLSTDVTLHSVFLTVVLNNKAEILGNWIGEVSTQDNKEFRIETTEMKIVPQTPLEVKFYVKFNTLKETPLLQMIRLNGKVICNADIPIQDTERPSVRPPSVIKPMVTVATTSPSGTTNLPSWQLPEGSLATNPINKPANELEQEAPVFNPGPKGAIPSRIDGATVDIVGNLPVFTAPSVDRQNQCGSMISGTTLIVNGTPTAEAEWPWQTALYHAEHADNKYICGGTLVSHSNIITAAHCVTLTNSRRTGNVFTYSVFLGKQNLITSVNGVEFRYLSKILVHEQYEPSLLRFDIAILEMQAPVPYSSWIQPACLWPENMISIDNVIGKIGTVVGWGYDGKTESSLALRKVGMPVISEVTCLRSYPDFYDRFISEYSYCAGYANGSSACNGDSGGGMMFQLGQSWYLRGVVSLAVAKRTDQYCDPKHYIVFTDVAKFLPWIKGNILNL